MFIFVLYHKHDHISTCSDMCTITISLLGSVRLIQSYRRGRTKLKNQIGISTTVHEIALTFSFLSSLSISFTLPLFISSLSSSPPIFISLYLSSFPFLLFVFPPPSLLSPSSLSLLSSSSLSPSSLSLSLSLSLLSLSLSLSLSLLSLPPLSLLSSSSLSPSSLSLSPSLPLSLRPPSLSLPPLSLPPLSLLPPSSLPPLSLSLSPSSLSPPLPPYLTYLRYQTTVTSLNEGGKKASTAISSAGTKIKSVSNIFITLYFILNSCLHEIQFTIEKLHV